MFNKYNRSNFLETQMVRNIHEKDLVMYNWNSFKMLRSGERIRLLEIFLHRPDLLSISRYGTMDYWWIIAKLNNIDDWWNDTYSGQLLIIPDIKDIEDFYANTLNKRI